MGIREALNQKPAIAAAAGTGLLAVGIAIAVWTNRPEADRVSRAYYTDDDGRTFFADDVDRIYPFDRNGKPAYRAYVYQCGSDKPFVSYVARYTDAARTKMAALSAKPTDPEAASEFAQLRNNSVEVKKPGDTSWVPELGAQGGKIAMHPQCPGGGTAKNLSP